MTSAEGKEGTRKDKEKRLKEGKIKRKHNENDPKLLNLGEQK